MSDTPDGRAAAEAAWDAVVGSEGDASPPPASAPTETTNLPTETAAAPPVAEATPTETPPEVSSEGRVRDAHGRFTKPPEVAAKTGTEAPKAAVKPTATPIPKAQAGATTAPPVAQEKTGTQAPQSELKAPGGWSPSAREGWGSIPTEAKAEIHRREREHAVTLQRAAPFVRAGQAFQQMVAPYEGLMRAQGAPEPMQAVAGVLQSYATLTQGPREARGQVLARLFKHSGLSIDEVAAAFDGVPQPQRGQQSFDPDAFRQQILADMRTQAQQERQTYSARQAEAEVESFRGQLEFFEEVREDMGDLMELAARRGQALSHDAAYQAALQLPQHSGTLAVLKRREEAQAAKVKQAEADRARQAGSSIRGQPTAAPAGGKPNGQWKDPRDAAVAAWEQHAGG